MSDGSGAIIVGLISDTHGLVRPSVAPAFADVDFILHAGDVGDDVLEELSLIAPIYAVRGNTDPPDPSLAESLDMDIGGFRVHVSHGHEIDIRPTAERLLSAYDADVIVYGHTHRQLIERDGDRWVVNPGAAGKRRFDLEPSVAIMRVENGQVSVELVPLPDR